MNNLLKDLEFAIAKNRKEWSIAEKKKDINKSMYCMGKANAYSEMKESLNQINYQTND